MSAADDFPPSNDAPKSDASSLLRTILIVLVVMLPQHRAVRQMLVSVLARLRLRVWLALRSRASDDDNDDDEKDVVVSALYVYPVKSLRTVSLQEATVDARGLAGDRRFMLVTPSPPPLHGGPPEVTHRFLTQRQAPCLATISAEINDDNRILTLSRGKDSIKVDLNKTTIPSSSSSSLSTWTARIWDDIVDVADVGDDAAQFFQSILDEEEDQKEDDIRLVAMTGDRSIDERFTPPETRTWLGASPQTGLNDGFPILVAFESSLRELNRRIQAKGKAPIPMSRFRPNIVIRGTKPFEEDHWKVVQIGDTILSFVKGCPRCKQSCTDQLTGEVFDEPVATLSEFRALGSNKEDVFFAQNAVPHDAGTTIRVGASVKVLKWGKPVWDENSREG